MLHFGSMNGILIAPVLQLPCDRTTTTTPSYSSEKLRALHHQHHSPLTTGRHLISLSARPHHLSLSARPIFKALSPDLKNAATDHQDKSFVYLLLPFVSQSLFSRQRIQTKDNLWKRRMLQELPV
ncbi:hypothetical protein P8452_36044 [Trifolium repens]|nr:hypothetical protein P8452_36044 [Trifolium repens]